MQTLLVIDDEPNIVYSVKECLATPTLRVISASTARDGMRLFREERPDVVLLDIRLPDLGGLDAFAQLHQTDSRTPILMMTAFTKTETAIEAIRRGAFDYFVKPVDLAQLTQVVERALKISRLNRVPALLEQDPEEEESADRILGHSPAMQEVYKAIGRISGQESPVLILGESGAGKELVARAIYHYSRRREKPFLAMNCAALPETLLESELFGHERGAFTGADQRRIGKFEQVSGGTIFLDEIGDMTPATQAKALRLLQEQQFERLGGSVTVKTDVRIIAATNQDLPQLVQEGRFRLDLFYRLNGFTIHLPALRERKADIPLLVEHFVRRFNRELNRRVRSVDEEAMELLTAHQWPGNVRELQSAIRYAVIHSGGDVITPESLPQSCRAAEWGEALKAGLPAGDRFDLKSRVETLLCDGLPDAYRRILAEVDEVIMQMIWQRTAGNQAQCAELLGLSRMTLRGKLRAVGLVPDRSED